MKRTLFFVTMAVIACGMYSCKSKEYAKPDTGMIRPEVTVAGMTDKYWKLVELMGQPVTYQEKAGSEAYMILKPDGTVTGNFSCNTFNGTYTMEGAVSRIRFSNMATTLKMCLDMSVEDQFKKVLEMADNYNLNGDQLILNRARMAPLARFEAVYLR